jgi:hypothetical protein
MSDRLQSIDRPEPPEDRPADDGLQGKDPILCGCGPAMILAQAVEEGDRREEQHEDHKRCNEGPEIARGVGHAAEKIAGTLAKTPDIDPEALLKLVDLQLAQARFAKSRKPTRSPASRIVTLVVVLAVLASAIIALQFFVSNMPRPEHRPAVGEQPAY